MRPETAGSPRPSSASSSEEPAGAQRHRNREGESPATPVAEERQWVYLPPLWSSYSTTREAGSGEFAYGSAGPCGRCERGIPLADPGIGEMGRASALAKQAIGEEGR